MLIDENDFFTGGTLFLFLCILFYLITALLTMNLLRVVPTVKGGYYCWRYKLSPRYM